MKLLLDLYIWYFKKALDNVLKTNVVLSIIIMDFISANVITFLGEILFKTGKLDFVSY